MDKYLKKQLVEHIDMMVKLELRADFAKRLGAIQIAEGAEEDIKRRANEVARIMRGGR